ncbi:MAG: hypothetical protein BWK79_16110 [Beggiatoa sp. IS2]|nr:MAG: hypothetical protein BWK79_16110 [Beggiatoa sp. IS2]
MQSLRNHLSGRPVIFGEVLYDIFETENKKVLGGAPFNVAWHLHGFAQRPLMITRVGQDAEGEEIHQIMQQWGMDALLVQRDGRYPTGQVRVSLTEEGSPRFEIPFEQAYDHFDAHQVLTSLQVKECSLLYHGTLALRHPTSRACLQAVATNMDVPIFLDVNLRTPWWEKDLVENVIKTATWLKMNEDELAVLTPHFKTASITVRETILDEICQQYQLGMVIVTLGAQGAVLKRPHQSLLEKCPPPIEVVDSVGAGDAFSAMCIVGLLQGWSPEILLERAVTFATAVCQIRGATTMDQDFYRRARLDF